MPWDVISVLPQQPLWSVCWSLVCCSHIRGVSTATTAAGKNRQQPKLCGRSTWSAAGDRAASTGNKLLSGRFITTCSHLTAGKAANMLAEYGGERYAILLHDGCRCDVMAATQQALATSLLHAMLGSLSVMQADASKVYRQRRQIPFLCLCVMQSCHGASARCSLETWSASGRGLRGWSAATTQP